MQFVDFCNIDTILTFPLHFGLLYDEAFLWFSEKVSSLTIKNNLRIIFGSKAEKNNNFEAQQQNKVS